MPEGDLVGRPPPARWMAGGENGGEVRGSRTPAPVRGRERWPRLRRGPGRWPPRVGDVGPDVCARLGGCRGGTPGCPPGATAGRGEARSGCHRRRGVRMGFSPWSLNSASRTVEPSVETAARPAAGRPVSAGVRDPLAGAAAPGPSGAAGGQGWPSDLVEREVGYGGGRRVWHGAPATVPQDHGRRTGPAPGRPVRTRGPPLNARAYPGSRGRRRLPHGGKQTSAGAGPDTATRRASRLPCGSDKRRSVDFLRGLIGGTTAGRLRHVPAVRPRNPSTTQSMDRTQAFINSDSRTCRAAEARWRTKISVGFDMNQTKERHGSAPTEFLKAALSRSS